MGFLLDKIPDYIKEPVVEGVGNAFNHHPKLTAITLIAVGIILTVGILTLSIYLGFDPFSMQYLTISVLCIGVGMMGMSLALHLILKHTGHKKLAYRVMWTVIPILGATGGALIFGNGFLAFLSGNASMMPFFTVAIGGSVVGFSLYAFGKHGLGDPVDQIVSRRRRNRQIQNKNINTLQRMQEKLRRRKSERC
ncbi:MAG: hypothetical protein KDK55_03240 [Chlamydiia bacterium]|nr:hypothetical protein [Chlamydiia bacterium]